MSFKERLIWEITRIFREVLRLPAVFWIALYALALCLMLALWIGLAR